MGEGPVQEKRTVSQRTRLAATLIDSGGALEGTPPEEGTTSSIPYEDSYSSSTEDVLGLFLFQEWQPTNLCWWSGGEVVAGTSYVAFLFFSQRCQQLLQRKTLTGLALCTEAHETTFCLLLLPSPPAFSSVRCGISTDLAQPSYFCGPGSVMQPRGASLYLSLQTGHFSSPQKDRETLLTSANHLELMRSEVQFKHNSVSTQSSNTAYRLIQIFHLIIESYAGVHVIYN